MAHMREIKPGDGQVWSGADRSPGELAPVLPEREWGLSAGQTTAIVLVILAACEVIGLLF